jgi:UDP-N-acetyl-2-amino-2-deoxyglucuronate dehydrogenase
MSERQLKTAVLGLDEGGQLLLKAASQIDHFQIQAVADKNTNLAEKTATEYKCSAYDDYRQLVIQSQFDCLLVAAGIYSCDEHILAAMKKKFNVLKLAPAARNFEEAAKFVRVAKDEGIKFAIANLSRFAQSFLTFHEFLQQGEIEQIFLIEAFHNAGDLIDSAWHTDPKLAGGGVLLRNCYEMFDQITWNFPMPQQVYSLNTNQAGDKQQRLYLTEDTAIIMMKFDDTLIGSLIALRRAGLRPRREFLRVYGKNKILTVSRSRLTVSDSSGETHKQLQYNDDALGCMTKLLKNFARSILSPDENKLCSSGRENLKNMAVIESAYLSARTGIPEEPGRILGIRSKRAVTPIDVLSTSK